MDRNGVAAEMSKHLRRQGILVQPMQLDAFVAVLPDEPGDLDAKALVQRYLMESQAYRWKARFSVHTWLIAYAGLHALFCGLVAIVAVRLIADAEGRIQLDALIVGIVSTSGGIVLTIYGAVRACRFWLAWRAAKPPAMRTNKPHAAGTNIPAVSTNVMAS